MSDSPKMPELQNTSIPGYDYGRTAAHSPVSLEELRQIEGSAGWTEDDARILGRYSKVFKDNAEEMVNEWRAAIGRQPHLAALFLGPDRKPDEEYKSAVKRRFVQWVIDASSRPHDQAWLDYQEEIALRHTPEKKNKTDGAQTPSSVPLRDLIAFATVITTTSRKFFVDAGIEGEDLQKVQDAWAKTLQLHIALWARPYTKDGLW